MASDQSTLKAGFQQKVQRAQASVKSDIESGLASLGGESEGGCANTPAGITIRILPQTVQGLPGLSSPHVLCVDSHYFLKVK